MKSSTNNNEHQRRLSLMALLTWFSATTSATPSLQHRVRRPERILEYQHVLDDRPRGLYEKFRIPSKKDGTQRGGRRLGRNPDLSLELHNYDEEDEEFVWSLSVQGGNIDEGHASSTTTTSSNGRSYSFPDSIRNLFEQFIGQGTAEGDISNVTAINITTEVTNATVNETTIYTTTTEGDGNYSQFNTSDPEMMEIFQPMRLRAILAEATGNGELLSDSERHALFHDMLSPALLSWSNTLRVDPVVGNLTVDVAQLVDGESCGPGIDSGLPSIRVPLTHLNEGIPDTDMIVYLSLGFVEPRLNNMTNTTYTDQDTSNEGGESINDAGRESVDGETRHLKGMDALYNETQDEIEALKVSGICNGEYLAAASFCSTDQFDRPTAALLHICIDEFFFDPDRRHRNILTLMHELGHALGYNSLSMAHFRRVDGTPYTERVDGDVPDTEIECTGPQAERRRARVALPSEEILQFREVRGGVRVAELVTPSVVQVVRNQFGCQNLTGAELESGEGLPLTTVEEGFGCLGDHWERRLFSSDLMNPVIDDLEYYPRISTLTLAYFADSGWYQVDVTGSQVASGWGRGAGCGFVNEACIGKNGEVPPENAPFFCNEIPGPQFREVASHVSGCTPDLSRKAICSMSYHGLELPWEYRYFQDTYGSDVGGNDPLMDYCPVYLGYDNGLCSSADTKDFMLASSIERFGERNSRCLVGSLNDGMQRSTALCLPIACVVEDQSLRIKIDRTWYRCEESGQEVGHGSVSVVCPDPRRICPTFYCLYDCLGTGGQCDYTSGTCLCEVPGLLVDFEPVLRACGEEEEEKPSTGGAFLRPAEPDRDDPALPHPDSPLSDYYVRTERALVEGEEGALEAWTIALIGVSGAVFASLVGFMCWTSKSERVDSHWSRAWFYRPTTSDARPSGGGSNETSIRNKDKMVATVLVDMRMNNNDGSLESLAETDEQLTESEASRGGAPSESMSEYSRSVSQRSESSSVIDTSRDDITEEEIQELQEGMQVIRRRKLAADK
jgi:hypothetical protein